MAIQTPHFEPQNFTLFGAPEKGGATESQPYELWAVFAESPYLATATSSKLNLLAVEHRSSLGRSSFGD